MQKAGHIVNWRSASSWAEQKLLKCKMLQGSALFPALEKPLVMSLSKGFSLQSIGDQCNAYYKVNRNFPLVQSIVLSHLYTRPYHLLIRINRVYLKKLREGEWKKPGALKPEKNASSLAYASRQGIK